jgi:hypothetical protein
LEKADQVSHTGYKQQAASFVGLVKLAAIRIWLRYNESMP